MSGRSRIYRERRLPAERPLAAVVAGLWKNGEQGAWYDHSDLSTMFQDVAGSVPVYMPGQGQPDCWIGLQLDKRFGLVRGPEKLTNGSFSDGATGWGVSGQDATHVATFAGGTLRFQVDTLSPAMQVQQLNAMTVGRWYEITVVVSAYVGGSIKTDALQAGGTGFVIANGGGTMRTIGLAVSSVFSFTRGATNTDITIDSISIRELPGNHRWQGTATSRPVLSARYNLLTYSEQFDASAWAKVECSVIPNVAVGPNGGMADKLVPSTATAQHTMTCSAGSAAESRTALVVAKADGCQKVTLWPGGSGSFAHFDLVTGIASREPNVLSVSMSPLGDGWYELRATWAVQTLAVLRIYTSLGSLGSANTPGDGVSGILLERADLRTVGDGVGLPPYQRVVDPNTYDVVGFPPYRKPDGADDWMQTAPVDFTGTDKVTAAIALRKLTDTNGIIFESSTDSSTVNGTFGLSSAPSALAGSIGARLRGTAAAGANAGGHAAPKSMVAVIAYDLAKASWDAAMSIRVNGVAQASTMEPAFTSGVGGGNFGNLPLYFDRRAGSALPALIRDYGTIIVGRLLSPAENAALDKFLRAKSKAY